MAEPPAAQVVTLTLFVFDLGLRLRVKLLFMKIFA
jgi:hypothetical protein